MDYSERKNISVLYDEQRDAKKSFDIEIENVDIIEENEIIKMLNNEINVVNHVHVPETTNFLDYVLGSFRDSVIAGCAYLFIKKRKRINVS